MFQNAHSDDKQIHPRWVVFPPGRIKPGHRAPSGSGHAAIRRWVVIIFLWRMRIDGWLDFRMISCCDKVMMMEVLLYTTLNSSIIVICKSISINNRTDDDDDDGDDDGGLCFRGCLICNGQSDGWGWWTSFSLVQLTRISSRAEISATAVIARIRNIEERIAEECYLHVFRLYFQQYFHASFGNQAWLAGTSMIFPFQCPFVRRFPSHLRLRSWPMTRSSKRCQTIKRQRHLGGYLWLFSWWKIWRLVDSGLFKCSVISQ